MTEGLSSIGLIGHSLGGDIAVVVAGQNSDLVGRLVICEANLDPLPPSTTGRFSQRIAAQTEADFATSGYQEILDTVPGWRPLLRLCDPVAVYRSAVGLITGTYPTMRSILLAATMPRTFIRGERGEPLRDEGGLRAAGVEVVTIPGAGHAMMLDAPEAFRAALAEALAVDRS